MKRLFYLVIILLLTTISCQQPKVEQVMNNDQEISKKDAVLSVIHNRKSVRHFIKGKEVSKEDLTELVKAGMAAPTAVNKQPWHFVVVTDRAKLDTLAEHLPYAKMLKDVTAAIIVCGDTSAKIEGMSFWMFDCSVASENILLAAEAMELGAVWTAVYPDESRISGVRNTLQLPENIMPLNVIPVGYPTGEDLPKNKYDEAKVHWNNW